MAAILYRPLCVDKLGYPCFCSSVMSFVCITLNSHVIYVVLIGWYYQYNIGVSNEMWTADKLLYKHVVGVILWLHISFTIYNITICSQIAKLMWPSWGSAESCRPQMGPMLAPWTWLSRLYTSLECRHISDIPCTIHLRLHTLLRHAVPDLLYSYMYLVSQRHRCH